MAASVKPDIRLSKAPGPAVGKRRWRSAAPPG